MSRRFSVRSDAFHRQNVRRLAVIFRKRELHACFFPSRLSTFDGTFSLVVLIIFGDMYLKSKQFFGAA
jgi:hypothetical protein